jgi:hypothetical protein
MYVPGTQLLAQASMSAQSGKSTTVRAATNQAIMTPMDMVNMPSVGPLFLETKTFNTSVSVVNAGTASVTATLVLRSLDGSTLLRKPVAIGGNSAVSLKVGDLLNSIGSKVQGGRIELYDDSVEGSGLAGQLTLSYADHRTRVHVIDEELTMPNMVTSHKLRGVAVDSVGPPFVTITNPTMQPQDVVASCYPENDRAEELRFTVQPEGTALLHGCRLLKDEFDAAWLKMPAASLVQGTAYAMELTAATPHGEIEAFGLAPNTLNGATEWTSVNFFDPSKLTSPTTIFAGIPVGNTPLLWGNYTPRLALHNFGAKSQVVNVRLATTESGFANINTLKTLTLEPNESRSLDVPGRNTSNELLNTLTVEGNDADGGIVSQLVLEDVSNDLRTQLIGKSGADDTNMGMHPWNLTNGEDDELLLYNQTGSAQHAYLKIGNGQEVWEKTVSLGAFATQRIQISSLIAKHDKDDHGKGLALGDGHGEISWSADAQSVLKGRLLQLNGANHTASSFQCAAYQVMCDGTIGGPTSITGGQQGSWTGNARGCINNYGSNYCWGAEGGSLSPYGFQWSVSGSIQLSTGLDSGTVSGTAVSPGTANLNVNMTGGSCVVSASTTVTINGYAPATVTGIYPNVWSAGENYLGVQITGTNFGSTPTISLSDPTIQIIRQPYNTSNSSGVSTTNVDLGVPQGTLSETVALTLTPGSGGTSFTQVPGGSSLPGSNTATVIASQNACATMLDTNSGFSMIGFGSGAGSAGTMKVSFSGGSFNGYSITAPYGKFSSPESIASHLAALITQKYAKSGLSAVAYGAYILYRSSAALGVANFTSSDSSFTANSPQSCPPVSMTLRLVPVVSRDEAQSSGTTMLHNVWRLVTLNGTVPSGGTYTVFEHLPIQIGNAVVPDGKGGWQSPAPGADAAPNKFDDGIGCRTMNTPFATVCVTHPPYWQKFTVTKTTGPNSGLSQSVMTLIPGQGSRLVMTIHEHGYNAGTMNNDSGPMPNYSPDPYLNDIPYPNY